MRLRSVTTMLTAAAACAGLICSTGATAATTPMAGAGTWGTAENVPGLGALGLLRFAQTTSVSCAGPGDCSAGGRYQDHSHHSQAFVVTETNGVWGKAEEVPGTAVLNQGRYAAVNTVSCAAPGDCAAGGIYSGSSGDQAFVVSEVNGTWGQAQDIPGLARFNAGDDAEVLSVSCAAPGDCSAGGYYSLSGQGQRAFVATETNGTWGLAKEAPGTAQLNRISALINSVSCAAPGDCSAGGYYTRISGQQAFVITQTDGIWGKAEEVPGTATLNSGREAQVNSVSCAAPGDCSAGGYYNIRSGPQTGFVVDESHGVWGTAQPVTGVQTFEITSVSCAAPGECSAVGDGTESSALQGLVATEHHGVWGGAQAVPGLAALNQESDAEAISVSCAAPGDCSAGGFYMANLGSQAFVVNEQDGSWGNAQEVAGTAETDADGGQLTSVSCAAPGDCGAGGYYVNGPNTRAYVVNETP